MRPTLKCAWISSKFRLSSPRLTKIRLVRKRCSFMYTTVGTVSWTTPQRLCWTRRNWISVTSHLRPSFQISQSTRTLSSSRSLTVVASNCPKKSCEDLVKTKKRSQSSKTSMLLSVAHPHRVYLPSRPSLTVTQSVFSIIWIRKVACCRFHKLWSFSRLTTKVTRVSVVTALKNSFLTWHSAIASLKWRHWHPNSRSSSILLKMQCRKKIAMKMDLLK